MAPCIQIICLLRKREKSEINIIAEKTLKEKSLVREKARTN